MSDFKGTVESLFDGMQKFISTKTVVGEAININDTIILPLVDVSFGVGAGAKEKGGSGGMGGKISPSAVLVIQNGHTKMVSVKGQDGVAKIIDMIPELVDKFVDKKNSKAETTEAAAPTEEKAEDTILE